MRLNYKRFPVIQQVKESKIPALSEYHRIVPEYVSQTLYDFLQGSRIKTQELVQHIESVQGIVLFNQSSEYYYKLNSKNFAVTHYNQGHGLSRFTGEFLDSVGDLGYFKFVEDKTFFNLLVQDPNYLGNEKLYISSIIEFLLQYTCLKQFTEDYEIEKISTEKKYGFKSSTSAGEQDIKTEFRFPIIVIDSRYVRTLIRSGTFEVRGFFRLQAYGVGRPQRRLVYIAPHVREKHNIKRKEFA